MDGHDVFLGTEVAKAFGHSTAELKAMGRKEKHRFRTEGNPTRTQRNVAGSRGYRRQRKADLKGGQWAATGAAVAESIRHPIATSGLNPQANYRLSAVQREAALKHKAKKVGVAKAHAVFLDQG